MLCIHTMQFYLERKNEIFRKIAEVIMYRVGEMELTYCESKRSQVQIPNTHVKARHGHAVLNLQCCLVGKDKWILGAPWQGNLSDTWSLSFCETLSQTTR